MTMFLWIGLSALLLWEMARSIQGATLEREREFFLAAPTFKELPDEARQRLRFDDRHTGWQRPVWIRLVHPPLVTCVTDRMVCHVWRKDDRSEGARRWTMVVRFNDRTHPWTLTFVGDRFRFGNIGGVDGPRCSAETLTPYELKLVNEFGRRVLGACHASAYV